MKKIIFGIFSILLISPVFSYEISPSWIHNSVIELNSSSSHSVLYLQGGIGDTSLYSKNPDGSLYLFNPLYFSLDQSDFGSVINSDNLGLLYGFSGSTNNTFSNGYGLISFGLHNNIPLLDYQWLYLQRPSSDGYNYSYSLSSGFLDVNSSEYTIGNVGNFYLRNFYSNNSLSSYQIFSKDYNYVLTNNGRIYDSVGSGKVAVFPSILDGYSSISLNSSGGLVFNTVFPGFSQFRDSNNHLPNFVETNKFIIFPLNGDSYNATNSYYGVLAKLGTGFAFSEYSCNGLSYTDYGSGIYYLNLSESCEFIDGGLSTSYYDYSPIVSNTYNYSCYDFYGSFKYIPFYSFFSNSSFPVSTYYGSTNFVCVLPSNNTPSSFNGSRDSLYVNAFLDGSTLFFTSIDNNTCVRSRTSYCPSSVAQNMWSGYVTSLSINFDGSVDLLNNFDNTRIPLTPEESIFNNFSNSLSVLCKLDRLNPLCVGGPYYQNTGSDISFTTDGSGNITATVTLYDTYNENCPDMYFTGSDGLLRHQYFDRVCYNSVVFQESNSTPEDDLTSNLTGLENNINFAFSGIVGENFKFYSCPFNSPLRAFHLSSIGGLSSFLLDKFFDVNLVGPFNCLLGGILYSETDSLSLGSRLLSGSYSGQKYLNNFSSDAKNTINWLLFAGMVLFFWSFRPKDH